MEDTNLPKIEILDEESLVKGFYYCVCCGHIVDGATYRDPQ